jgi:hypothetical protein
MSKCIKEYDWYSYPLLTKPFIAMIPGAYTEAYIGTTNENKIIADLKEATQYIRMLLR